MVKIRREGNKTTWLLEADTLPERLEELAEIFNFHSKEQSSERIDQRFMAEIMALQTKSLAEMARAQELELERLRKVENEVALLREEFRAEIAKLKQPEHGRLQKPAMHAPSKAGKP